MTSNDLIHISSWFRLLASFCLLCISHLGTAQVQIDSLFLSEIQENGRIQLISSAKIAITGAQKGLSDFSEVPQWRSLDDVKSELLKPREKTHYWFRIESIINTTEKDQSFLLYYGGQERTTTLLIDQKDTIRIDAGFLEPMHKRPYRVDDYRFPITFKPGIHYQLLAKARPFAQSPYGMTIEMTTEQEFLTRRNKSRIRNLPLTIFYSGVCMVFLFISLFSAVQYFQNRDKSFILYAGYIFCMFLYFLKEVEFDLSVPIFWGFMGRGYSIAETYASLASYVFYGLFAKTFLDTKNIAPGLNKMLNLFVKGMVALFVILILMEFIDHVRGFQIYYVFRIIIIPLVLFFVYRFYKLHKRLANFMVAGTLALATGAVVGLIFTVTGLMNRQTIFYDPYFYIGMGVVFEAFFFSTGLGYKMRLIEKDKLDAQNELLVKKKAEAELQQNLAEERMRALKAQMNPHFIFNAMNSIQYYILSNEKKPALGFLNKFAKLIRQVLDNSSEDQLTLHAELEALRYYIDLEALRLNHKFDYKIVIDESIEPEETIIPHLLIQPYVENAIQHGLAQKTDPGFLKIEVKREEKAIVIVIEDNGIGREAATALRVKGHKSKSMGINKERMEMLEKNPGVLIEDLYDQEGQSAGTRVTVQIPI